MVSVTRAAHNIEITAESLQEDLTRLEVQRRALERELAAVVAHLGSVQRALSALEALMLDPAGSTPAVTPRAAAAAPDQASSPAELQTNIYSSADVASKPERQAKRPAAPGASTDADKQTEYGKLTEQILEYFAGVDDADVRARDVAAALGRDADSGSINAVRSTLDRLVGASRIRRTGRGLYRAQHA